MARFSVTAPGTQNSGAAPVCSGVSLLVFLVFLEFSFYVAGWVLMNVKGFSEQRLIPPSDFLYG